MNTNMKNKYVWITLVVIIIIITSLINFRSKGSQYLPNKTDEPVYTWKSGSVKSKGLVSPDSCGLTTKDCTCNLSSDHETCTFNFNFSDMNQSAHMIIKEVTPFTSSITYSTNSGCDPSVDSKQINGCSIDFHWDKTTPSNNKAQIQLSSKQGVQTLINLNIIAKATAN